MRKSRRRLRDLREAAGLSQVGLAKLIGVTRNAISQWESGETVPSSRRLAKLGKVLGVSVDSIFSEVNHDVKAKILTAAERLVARLGVRGTTVEIVCASADVTLQQFDNSFDTLEQLFNEIVRLHTERQFEQLRQTPPLYGSVLARLKYLLRSRYVTDTERVGLTAELRAYSWTWGEKQERAHLVQLYTLDQYIISIFEDAASKGQIKRGNFMEAAQLILATYDFSLRKAVFENYDADRMIQHVTPKLMIILEAFDYKDVPGFSDGE